MVYYSRRDGTPILIPNVGDAVMIHFAHADNPPFEAEVIRVTERHSYTKTEDGVFQTAPLITYSVNIEGEQQIKSCDASYVDKILKQTPYRVCEERKNFYSLTARRRKLNQLDKRLAKSTKNPGIRGGSPFVLAVGVVCDLDIDLPFGLDPFQFNHEWEKAGRPGYLYEDCRGSVVCVKWKTFSKWVRRVLPRIAMTKRRHVENSIEMNAMYESQYRADALRWR